jgi:molecular chaperone DnaK (HSP70)
MGIAARPAVPTIAHVLPCAGRRTGDVDQVAVIGGSAAGPDAQRIAASVFPARGVTSAPRADVAAAVSAMLVTARSGGGPPSVRCSTPQG